MKSLIWPAIISVVIHSSFLGSNLQWLKAPLKNQAKQQSISLSMTYQKSFQSINKKNLTPAITKKQKTHVLKNLPQKHLLRNKVVEKKLIKNNPSIKQERSVTQTQVTRTPIKKIRETDLLRSLDRSVEYPNPTKGKSRRFSNHQNTDPDNIVEAIPHYDVNPPPVYPSMARRRKLSGTVILDVLVNVKGSVDNLFVYKSSGYSILDNTAVRSVERWIFTPGKRGNIEVAMHVLVPVHFKIR